MRKLLVVWFLVIASAVIFTQGPLTPFGQIRLRTDSSGNLLMAGDTSGSGQGPLTPASNLMVRTDSSGNLLVSLAAGVGNFGDGTASAPSITFASATGMGFYKAATTSTAWVGGSGAASLMFFQNGINQRSDGVYCWSSTVDPTGGCDTSIGRTSANQISVLRGAVIPMKVFTAANFTSAANTSLQAITGLSFTFPAGFATTAQISCNGTYSIATAAVAVDFGVQDVTVAPTNALFEGFQWIATGSAAPTIGTQVAFATTTATSITSATPGATATVYPWALNGLIEHPSNGSTSVFQVMIKTANSADLPTVQRGSYCSVF